MKPNALVRVLLIEDQIKDADQIISMLHQYEGSYSYTVDHCTDLDEGIEFFKNNISIDVVLSDVFFAEKGITFELLDNVTSHIPIIYIASSKKNLAYKAIRNGAQDYLMKGQFDQELLVRTIQYSIERKELEQRKEDFISAVSHELKTPLTSQRAFIRLLDKTIDKNKDIQYKRYIKKIADQTDKLSRLVNDLLDASKIQGGKLDLNIDACNIHDVVRETIEEIQQTTDLHITLQNPLNIIVHTDKERIGQVITNLLTNAIKYSSKKKKVYVMMKQQQDTVIISVKDFGIGIDKENQKKLFQKFFRAKEISDQTFPGLGMGLFISHEIVKLLGGSMQVESKKGEGSIFSFSLPI